MKRAWQIMCLAFVAASAITLIGSLGYPYRDRLGPGPGFFPVWLGLITGGLSLALLFQVTFAREAPFGKGSPLPEDRAGTIRIFIILAGLVGSLVFLDILGFRITLFLFLLFLPPALGLRRWVFTAIFSLLGSFGVFHLFYYWLKVPLPMGVLGI
ncbi:MAG: tripartite tricarboxylate transporter TctB family protein [Syntrophaceae bacterium]|jgi:putative tricarboxylic transport membrane protein|nr:tripartite tricarboxylate transporter TctB family protein [Syntrophaceae bacterium]